MAVTVWEGALETSAKFPFQGFRVAARAGMVCDQRIAKKKLQLMEIIGRPWSNKKPLG
jgi:hypothetical protein